ncbi:MAG: hypothetical protein VZQ47_06595 [Treponema sp.]|nr:hypothetical protein [Treponema sp.]MEE3435207.1 hypothetical protein [Treponema sp.]
MTEKGRNRISFLRKKTLSLLLAFACAKAAFSVEAQSLQDKSWVLAASKFSVEGATSKAAQSAASVLPKLILERISVDVDRSIMADEKAARKNDELLIERLDLFLQLSKEIKARDALVLNNYNNIAFELALNDAQKKIKAIQDKIDANLKKQEGVYHPEKSKKKVLRELRPDLMESTEKIALYKNDSEALFEASEDAQKQGVFSRTYEKEAASAKINAVISGKITFFGGYACATVDLVVFPGGKKTASAMEVGSLSQISLIAENIAFELLPKIANGLPVELEFRVSPKEALANAVLTIDNIVYDPMPEKAVVSSGFHSVSFEADNFARETFVYNFSGRRRFFIEVNFKEKSEGSVKLVLSKFVPGDIFFDGKYIGPSSKTDYVDVPLKVNGDTVFGYFESELADKRHPENTHNEIMFMQIPRNLMTDGNRLQTKIKVFDVSKNIDRRRKMMYLSYSALILSLPYLFYTYGRFTTYQRGVQTNYGDVQRDEYNKYRTLSLVGTGITAACGVWFVCELVAYLIAVDKTLPPKAKKIKAGTQRKMEVARQLEAVQEMMQSESEAIAPYMPKKTLGPKNKDEADQ